MVEHNVGVVIKRCVVARVEKRGKADFLATLADRERARDDELPNTGVSREWERALSAPFITGDNYGTRCSTVLTISRDGDARFVEQSFDARGATSGCVDYAFRLAAR